MRTLLVLLLGVLMVHGEERRDLILVAGQSNSVGYDAFPDDLPPNDGDKEVLFWYRCGDPPPDDHDSTSGGKWTTLQAQPRGKPMTRETGKGEAAFGFGRQYGNFSNPKGGFGPEIGFAREWRLHEKRPLAIVKAAFSGTGLRTDWNPKDPGDAGACYRALVKETQSAIAAAKEKGIILSIRGMIWVQGESDCNAGDAPKYTERMSAMINALRQDLSVPELLVMMSFNSKFDGGKKAFAAQVVDAQKAVSKNLGRTFYVDLVGAETLAPSHTHYTAKGTLEIGKRFATALKNYEEQERKSAR